MTSWDDFRKWFNRSFWRAFKNRTLPIRVPETAADREATVRRVFDSIHSARYASSIPEAEIVSNKGYGVARTIPVFCIEDYIVYYFCIKELEDVLCGNRTENTFGGWTLGGRMRQLEELEVKFGTGFYGSRYSFNPFAWVQAFGEFNSLLYAQLDTGEFSHVLQFDLANFYDCIRLDILERWIREECPKEKGWIIALLFYFLNQWNRRKTGLHPQAVGIPQDALADCSRILANYYLQQYDNFAAAICAKANAVYFRYADDQMILLRNTRVVERLMLLLSRNLDRYGLRINQKKVELWDVRKLQEHRCRKLQELFAKKGDNKDPALVREFVERYLKMTAEDVKRSWNGGLPILNRLLWANLESLPEGLYEPILIRLTSDDYLLGADKGKLVRIHELNLRRKQPPDFFRRIRDLSAKCVHNGFLYEALSFSMEIKNDDLSKYLQSRLEKVEKDMLSNEL